MTYQVRVSEKEIAFPCEPNEFVLDAAERAGFTIPYSCRKGVCNTCECALIAGEVDQQGVGVVHGRCETVLMCRSRPHTDLVIQPKRIEKSEPLARKTVTANVFRLTRPAADVSVLHLRFPIGVRARFKAGQYVQVFLPDGDRRNFSMANPTHQNDGVELHIRHVPGGRFSEQVLSTLAPGAKLRVELPYGDFFLRPSPATPTILLATGTGFSPIKSIVESAIKQGDSRPMRLYWGARRHEDLYLAGLPLKWQKSFSWFSFVPVLSEPDRDWRGRTGLVHRSVLEDHADLSAFEIYACGNPAMIAAAQSEFTGSHGLLEERFYCDPFVPTGMASTPTEPAGQRDDAIRHQEAALASSRA
jgi:CDP-4-dehydro-6-deoxyglucose reductase/3-phenylpropionate/trans-cinnamate dioxygenase ferredoxin reductase subunit